MTTLKARLEEEARDAGFDAIGFSGPDDTQEAGRHFREFLAQGRHGTMQWMVDKADWRESPKALWPDVESVIVLAMNYGPPDNPLEIHPADDEGNISVYARHRDYHDLVKKRLKRVARWLVAETGEQVKVFVDTAPVLEKPLAQAAGMGWQGKHTNLVSRDFGSWLFIGSIYTTMKFEAGAPDRDHCGSCRNCLDVCPTNAFPAPYQLDARRCISYHTIELKDVVPLEFREAMGNRIYGCDDCLAACPWNKFAETSRQSAFLPREDLLAPKLAELAELDDTTFRTFFSGSPIKRIGRNKFLSNVLIAMGNSGAPALIPNVERHLNDPDDRVGEAAAWAMEKLKQCE